MLRPWCSRRDRVMVLLRRYMRTGGDQHRPEAPQIPQDQAAGIGPGEGCRKALFPGAAGGAGGGESTSRYRCLFLKYGFIYIKPPYAVALPCL